MITILFKKKIVCVYICIKVTNHPSLPETEVFAGCGNPSAKTGKIQDKLGMR